MSLPSIAYFLKNGSIVAEAFINIGWHIYPEGIIRCCYEAYNTCLTSEQTHTLDDWKAFDHILLYDYIIPRTTLNQYFLGNITEKEFVQRFVDGSYYSHFNKWFKNREKLYSDFNKKLKTKGN